MGLYWADCMRKDDTLAQSERAGRKLTVRERIQFIALNCGAFMT